jgi:hypothetical protein
MRQTKRWLTVGTIGGVLAGLWGCEQKPAPPPARESTPAAQTPAVPPSTDAAKPPGQPSEADLAALRALVTGKAESDPVAALPPGHPPLTPPAGTSAARLPAGHPPTGAPLGSPAAADGPELKFTPPGGWQSQPVRSALRKAQYALPRVGDDGEDGELVVFFFGRNEGGAVRENIERWISQFSTPEGLPIPPEATREDAFEAQGMKVTMLDVAGRFTPGPGMGSSEPRDNVRMLAAVIETPDGNWFVRATGPLATMQEHRPAFIEFLKSVQR